MLGHCCVFGRSVAEGRRVGTAAVGMEFGCSGGFWWCLSRRPRPLTHQERLPGHLVAAVVRENMGLAARLHLDFVEAPPAQLQRGLRQVLAGFGGSARKQSGPHQGSSNGVSPKARARLPHSGQRHKGNRYRGSPRLLPGPESPAYPPTA